MNEVDKTKRFAYKNLFVVSFSILLLYTAFLPFQDLQVSLYSEEGFASLFSLYTGKAIGSLVLSIIFLDAYGPKITLMISVVGYLLFILANCHGTWLILIPAAIINGFCLGTLWTSVAAYIKDLSNVYAAATNEIDADIFSTFYPIFFSFHKISQITGNVIASNVLHFTRRSLNVTGSETNCGPAFYPFMKLPGENLHVTQFQITSLALISLGIGCISFFLIILFLDRFTNLEQSTKINYSESIISIFRQISDVRIILLTPIIVLSGLQAGFIYADFTSAYITCYLGIDMIGWVMSSLGLFSFASSILYSRFGKCIGSFNILIGTTIVQISLLAWLLCWNAINTDKLYPYLLFAGLYGACDSAWRTQIPVIMRTIFTTGHDKVFSLLEFWKAMGFVIGFAYGDYLRASTKIYIIIGVMLVGMVSFGIVVQVHKQSTKGWKRMNNSE